MVKKRATIIVSGNVQDVGYRATITRIGQKSGLTGYVENLPDGTVRVICEGAEESIRKFQKNLDISEDGIDVDGIQVKWSKAQGKFKYFNVKYSDLGSEMFQGFATAGRMLGEVKSEIGGVRSDIRGMSKKQDTMNEKLGHMDGKLDSIDNRLKSSDDKLSTIDTRLGDALVRYDTFGKKMISIETEMKEFTKQITRLVDHLTDTKK
jgi:acylphosphatase